MKVVRGNDGLRETIGCSDVVNYTECPSVRMNVGLTNVFDNVKVEV
jgi:hypothetical protein